MQYETERLYLKPAELKDAAFFLEMMNQPKWIQNIGDRKVRTLQDSEKYIKEKMLPQYEEFGFGNNVIIRKEDGSKVGSCGIFRREGLEIADLGYALLSRHERNGYAIEASRKVLEIAQNDFAMDTFSAITSISNLASQNLLIKLGFEFKKMITLPNDNEELKYFELCSSHKT